jgi:cadmium resistance protein CadD (predicted permease)
MTHSVLVDFFRDPRLRHADVVVGQFIGMAVIVAATIIFGLVALVIPDRYIGSLGFLPILIGLKLLWSERRRPIDSENLDFIRGARGATLSVAAVTIANGGDNFAVYVPIFASPTMSEVILICVTFGVMTGLWCLCGKLLASHPLIGARGGGQPLRSQDRTLCTHCDRHLHPMEDRNDCSVRALDQQKGAKPTLSMVCEASAIHAVHNSGPALMATRCV